MIGGALVLTVLVGIAVAPRAIEKLEDWAAERQERRRQRARADEVEREGSGLVVMASSAEVLRSRARRTGDGQDVGREDQLRHRHSVSTSIRRLNRTNPNRDQSHWLRLTRHNLDDAQR